MRCRRAVLHAFGLIVGLAVIFLLLYAVRELPTPAFLTGPSTLTDRTWRWLPSAELIHPRMPIRLTGTVEFSTSKARVMVRTPCGNVAFGSYLVVMGRIFFTGGEGITLLECPGAESLQHEQRLLAVFSGARRFEIVGPRLTLIDRTGKDVLVFDTYPDP